MTAASAGDARSVAALFLAAGAQPEEIDAAVAVLIELVQGRPAPSTYAEVASQPMQALAELRRRRNPPVVVNAVPEEPADEHYHRASQSVDQP